MTTHQRDSCIVFNTVDFQEKISALSVPFVDRFVQINRNYALFHFFFVLTIFCEFIFLGIYFPKFVQTTLMAFCLAIVFLTLFTYLVLLFYLQGRRPERLMQLREEYIQQTQTCIPFDLGTLEYHCCITQAIVHLISLLKIPSIENRFIRASETFSYLSEKFRIWNRWKSLLKLKEMLLLTSIQEHIRLIKSQPADLEAHASLASNYVALATLYQDPKKLALNENLCWTPPEYESEEMHKKFAMALERALEEYQIIDEYAPNDPWVHAQKASLYQELGQADKEQKEYEKILEMDPQNGEILLRLGRLYFCKGENAKGLKIYNHLRMIDAEKAQEVISHYDAYPVEEYSFESG